MAAVLVVLLAAAYANPRTYGSNDNFGIIDNARAGYATPYAGFAMTYGLHILYASWPDIPWLGIALYVLLLSAAAVISYLVAVDSSSRAIQGAAGIVVVSCFLPFMLRPDYNASSILLGGSAVYLLVFSGDSRRGLWFSALIVLLCYCSYSTRRMGFLGSACLATPFALGGLWRASRVKRSQMAFVAAIVAVLILADNFAYRASMSQGYREFIAFNDIRKGIHNTPYIQSGWIDPKALAATGWTENDYWLFARWFYLDEERFNIPSVAALRRFVRDGSMIHPSPMRSLGVLWGEYGGNLAMVVAVSTLPFLWKSLRDAAWAAFALMASAAGALLLETYWHFPGQIALPFIAVAALGFICISLPLPSRSSLSKWLGVAVAVGVVSYLGITETLRNRMENMDRNTAFGKSLDRLNALPADSIVLFEGGTLEMDWSDPIHSWSLKPYQIRTGMSIFSPAFYGALQHLGLHKASELLPFLAKSGRGYVVVNDDTMPHLIRFAREAYGLELEATVMGTLESGAQIFKLSLGPGRH